MSYSVLLVEDSYQICEGIVDYFANRVGDEFSFDVFYDGAQAITNIANKKDYDIVFLDIMLPGASGFDVCRAIRRASNCPIIFITALGTEDNILRGYDLGADDYIVKPFSLNQLFAKTQALLKRSSSQNLINRRIALEDIEIDCVTMQAYVNGKVVETTAKEYFLLKTFLENKGMIMTRDRLLSKVWGYDFSGSERVVDTYVKKLRKVLGKSGSHIKTVIGKGYMML